MGLSKSRQRQFIAITNAEQVGAFAFETSNPNRNTQKAIGRLQRRLNALKEPLLTTATPKDIAACQKKYLKAIRDRSEDDAISITEHIGTCLRLAEDCREKGAQPKREWDYLVQGLFTIYQHYDPEIENTNQERAQKVGEEIIMQFS